MLKMQRKVNGRCEVLQNILFEVQVPQLESQIFVSRTKLKLQRHELSVVLLFDAIGSAEAFAKTSVAAPY